MIKTTINEITVFADKLEDDGLNVSLLRLLSIYNYPCNILVESNGFEYNMDGTAGFGSGGYNGEADDGSGGMYYSERDFNFYFKEIDFRGDSIMSFGFGDGSSYGAGYGYGFFIYGNLDSSIIIDNQISIVLG